jgi:hypothetical protein
MKQNSRTFVHGSLSIMGEQKLLFLCSTLFTKVRKSLFVMLLASVYVVPEYASIACTCVTEQCMSLWQLVYVVTAALTPHFHCSTIIRLLCT